ncbi:MAG: DUF2332 family protein, partial [Pseudomonadota bacterium]
QHAPKARRPLSVTPALTAAFARQAEACAGLGSPFMARLLPQVLRAISPASALGLRLSSWPEERLGPSRDSVPLRLAGGLHRLVLSGEASPLASVYPPNEASDAALLAALQETCAAHEASLLAAVDTPPQTNEVRRAAVLIAAGHWLTARHGLPLTVSEIGASAGLNLNWDFFCLRVGDHVLGPRHSPVQLAPEWTGQPPHICPAYVADAEGVDLRPVDAAREEGALTLKSYLWPDQPERRALTEAAIALFRRPDSGATMVAGDALSWLPGRLTPRSGHCHMLYSTVAWQYLDDAARKAGQAMIEAAGRRASASTPLAWFRMEADSESPGAALTMTTWPGGETSFGRADFHGRWVDWQAPDPTSGLQGGSS